MAAAPVQVETPEPMAIPPRSSMTASRPTDLRVDAFDPLWAAEVAAWVQTEQDLLWLAPSTEPPLTSRKVVEWVKPGGSAYALCRADGHGPSTLVGYCELNPIRSRTTDLWIGHVVIRPADRGRGYGRFFLRWLSAEALDRRGAERICLVVFPRNAPAIRCYESAGFRRVGEELHRTGASGSSYRLLRYELTQTDYRATAAARPSSFGDRSAP